ncbi:M15 family metallopeptidase [Pseudoclavibacter terrae]|uniref:D-alanyl-D-alanine carboxypeptidase-like core domain-containing protein n=1 Tax=Pseudoclavibacter terrae TaxID=1530195 RepID=A0A7J5B6Q3_9MICO|nr:M15 family metallopeptidase [Pseudoclavibacter terrae]KAB1639879.1 hypothetical protein F8O03_06100 [Pseudoclavibacter terrae]
MVAVDIGFPNGDPRNATGSAFGYKLRDEAAGAFLTLADEYREAWGEDPRIVEAMRSLEEQLRLYNGYAAGKPGFNLAAKPVWRNGQWYGTSLHGAGLSTDLGWPLNSSLTAQHAWFATNAPRFGWEWTGRNFSQVEAWHFDYTGVNVTAAQRAAYISRGLGQINQEGFLMALSEAQQKTILENSESIAKSVAKLEQLIGNASSIRAFNTGKTIEVVNVNTGRQVHVPNVTYSQMYHDYDLFVGSATNVPLHILAHFRDLMDKLGRRDVSDEELQRVADKLHELIAAEAKG